MQGLQILPCLLGHTSASRNQPSTPLLTLSSKIKSKAKLREYYIIITINAKGEINYSWQVLILLFNELLENAH